MKDRKKNDWDRARYYLAWAKRQGFSPDVIATIPDHPSLNLSEQDKEIIRGLANLKAA